MKKSLSGNRSVALIKIVQTHTTQPPMGLLFVGGALKKEGYSVKLWHLTKDEALDRMEEVIGFAPFLVGFSMITGDPGGVILQCCRLLKNSLPEVYTVFGGVHPTLEPVQCLEEDCVDFVVLHEGEETAVALAHALNRGESPTDIVGLGYKLDGQVRTNPVERFLRNLDDYEMDWSLVDVEEYIKPYSGLSRVLMGYVASRGCPHNCAFCYNEFFNRRRWRSQTPEKVTQELNRLVNGHHLDGVLFYDDNFTANRKRCLQILDGVKVPGIHIETRVDYLKKEFVEALAARGVKTLFLGVESGSDRLLKLIRKGITTDDIHRALDLLKDYPFEVRVSMILGIPTETIEEYRASLRLIVWCIESLPRVAFNIGFYIPYPGTPLFDLCLERGFKKPGKFEEWEALDRWGTGHPMAITWTEGDYLSQQEVVELRRLQGRLRELWASNSPYDRARYVLYKYRFIYSGTLALRVLLRFIRPVRRVLGPLKRALQL